MGRAGLAVPYDFQHSGQLNPAVYGLFPKESRFAVPKVGLRLQSLNFGDLDDVTSGISNGSASGSTIQKLSQLFGNRDTEFGLDTTFGAAFSGFAVDFSGNGIGIGRPNAVLSGHLNGGGSIATAPVGSRFDGYGVGGYNLSVATASRIGVGSGDEGVAVGVRARYTKTYYSHYKVDTASQFSDPSALATLAEDMGGKSALEKSGLGVDVGGIWSSSKTQGLFVGAVIENLVKPDNDFSVASPNTTVPNSTVSPYSRRFNLGVGYMAKKDLVLAADLYDVFGGSSREFRAGAEWNLGSAFSLRAGYESGTGLTYGFGISGLNFAFGSNLPAAFTTAFKF